MEMSPVAVKKTSGSVLSKNRLSAYGVSLILISSLILCRLCASLLSFAVNDTAGTVLFAALLIFLFFPLFIGAVRYFRTIVFEAPATAEDMFVFFSSFEAYKRAFGLTVGMVFRTLLFSFFSFIPYAALKLAASSFVYDLFGVSAPLWSANLSVPSSFMLALGAVLSAWFSLRLYLAPFLLACDDEMTAAEALHMSWTISRRSLSGYIILILSLIGYILLGVLILPLFFTLPYFLCCYTVHAKFAVTRYNAAVDRICDENMSNEIKVK